MEGGLLTDGQLDGADPCPEPVEQLVERALKLARSRSSLLMKIIRGTPSSVAIFQHA